MIDAVSEIDKARLAAYIDGEGTIYINVATGLHGRHKTPQYRLSVVISNTDHRLMNWLKSTFDGSVYYVKYEKSKHLGKKPIMRWQMNERMAETLLKACLPYMIMKKAQAEVGLSFMSLKLSREIRVRDGRGRIIQMPLTDAEIAKRHAMKLEIERLNKSTGLEIAS